MGQFTDGNNVELTLTGDVHTKTVMLLKLTGQDIYFALPFFDAGDGDEGMHYLVEEHSCPSNFLRRPLYVIGKGQDGIYRFDTDPHGILEYVEMVPRPPNWGDDHGLHSTTNADADVVSMFPSLQRRLRELNVTKLRALS